MAKDRIEGAGKGIGGSIRNWVGKLTGNRKLRNESKAERAKGKVRNVVGKAEHKVRKP